MSPQQIITALAITTTTVKVIGDSVLHLHPIDAIAAIRRYPGDWSAKIRTSGQVKWIRRAEHRRSCSFVWQACYRTTEAPAIQPSVEWLNHLRGGRGNCS